MRNIKYLFAVAAMFGIMVASCNKNDVLDDNTNPPKQKAGEKIIYVDNVNKEIAGGVATTFFEGLDGIKTAKIVDLDSIVDWDGKTAMYIFNFTPAGFVLTSADVRNEPIVA